MSRYVDLDKLTWKAVMVRDVAVPIYLKDEVDNAPTEDVAPVVHAYWYMTIKGGYPLFGCSNCDDVSSFDYNYCPYCGAKMDEEVEE